MNERSKSQSKSKPSRNEMEVEQLLQAAQDELVLNLSINSHMSRVSPNYIDSDLDRRFQALKKSGSSVPQESSSKKTYVDDKELKAVMGDDLSARFAALKGSSSSSSNPDVGVGPKNILSDDGDGDGDGDEDEEDEVEKLIRWAKDAARLDPSPPSDDDDHDEEEEEDDDDEEEEDYKDEHQKPKGHHHRK
jgi:hypothetical protein